MLPEALQFALKERPASFKIRLGKALEKRIDTCYGKDNLRLERGKNDRKRVGLWRVIAGSAGSVSYPQRREKLKVEEKNREKENSDNSLHSLHSHHGRKAQHGSRGGVMPHESHANTQQSAGSVNQLPTDDDEMEELE